MPLVTVPVLIKTRISIVDFMWQERSPYMEDAITHFSSEFRSAFGIIMASLKPSKVLYYALIRRFLVRLLSRLSYLMCNISAFSRFHTPPIYFSRIHCQVKQLMTSWDFTLSTRNVKKLMLVKYSYIYFGRFSCSFQVTVVDLLPLVKVSITGEKLGKKGV